MIQVGSGRIRRLGLFPAVAAVLFALAFLGQPLDRSDALALGGVEHDDALGGAAVNADAVDRAADELPAVGDQHDLVALLDRERADQPPVLLGDRHGDDAFAAAVGSAVLVGRRALAETLFGNRQHELFGGGQFRIAGLAELDRAGRLFGIAAVAAVAAVVLGFAV